MSRVAAAWPVGVGCAAGMRGEGGSVVCDGQNDSRLAEVDQKVNIDT
jgi:hypothetical protein